MVIIITEILIFVIVSLWSQTSLILLSKTAFLESVNIILF